ncbi:hypothetical protein PV11_03507 [Exophiala sideris]|uniref:AtuA-like ferredoxin-fold domain-containing protein n=1 Tax=Exophiala sideris TaxID=1016849 RepID=A0A0D1VY61_9EURO|nr:hypothetical protein PV11_03507 [Exophiala sideris]
MTLDKFAYWCKSMILQSYPGGTSNADTRQAIGKPYFEYWVSLLPQKYVHRVHLPNGGAEDIPTPPVTKEYPCQQPLYNTENPVSLSSSGPLTPAPLGFVVLARSGDKSSDANAGFFVRHDDDWDWLRSLLSLDKIKELLSRDYVGKPIDRFQNPEIRAVHFLFRDHLDRGYNACGKLDSLGKNICEYMRVSYQILRTWADIDIGVNSMPADGMCSMGTQYRGPYH